MQTYLPAAAAVKELGYAVCSIAYIETGANLRLTRGKSFPQMSAWTTDTWVYGEKIQIIFPAMFIYW